MENVILSVIIPIYNTEKNLERCIESVVNQADDSTEIILVNDGSTDGSQKICDKYTCQYENVKLLVKENGGLSSARNYGLTYAQGKYVAFLDSDDMWSSGFIEDFKSYAKTKWDILNFNYCYEKTLNVYKQNGTKNVELYNQNEFIDLFNKNIYGNQICFRIYKRSLFENVTFPLGRYYEDIATFYKLMLKANKILCVDYDYYIYNIINEESITKQVTRKHLEDMLKSTNEMYKGLSDYYNVNGYDLKYLEYNKINLYSYIGLKLMKCNENVDDLKSLVCDYVKKQKVNLIDYKKYQWKKYVALKLLITFGLFK